MFCCCWGFVGRITRKKWLRTSIEINPISCLLVCLREERERETKGPTLNICRVTNETDPVYTILFFVSSICWIFSWSSWWRCGSSSPWRMTVSGGRRAVRAEGPEGGRREGRRWWQSVRRRPPGGPPAWWPCPGRCARTLASRSCSSCPASADSRQNCESWKYPSVSQATGRLANIALLSVTISLLILGYKAWLPLSG